MEGEDKGKVHQLLGLGVQRASVMSLLEVVRVALTGVEVAAPEFRHFSPHQNGAGKKLEGEASLLTRPRVQGVTCNRKATYAIPKRRLWPFGPFHVRLYFGRHVADLLLVDSWPRWTTARSAPRSATSFLTSNFLIPRAGPSPCSTGVMAGVRSSSSTEARFGDRIAKRS